MKTQSFKDLIVWQKAYQLVIEIYQWSQAFPKEERYGITQQMQRAAVSIPSNISEGYGRQFHKEYKQFLSISYSSLCELETQYLLSIDLGYGEKNLTIEMLMKEVGAMLFRMMNPKDSSLSAVR
jgi:four helix bundle protein